MHSPLPLRHFSDGVLELWPRDFLKTLDTWARPPKAVVFICPQDIQNWPPNKAGRLALHDFVDRTARAVDGWSGEYSNDPTTSYAEMSRALSWDNASLKYYLTRPDSVGYIDGRLTGPHGRVTEHSFGALVKLPNIEGDFATQLEGLTGIEAGHFKIPKALNRQLQMAEAVREVARIGRPKEAGHKQAVEFIDVNPDFFPNLGGMDYAACQVFTDVFSSKVSFGRLARALGWKAEVTPQQKFLQRYAEDYGLNGNNIEEVLNHARNDLKSIASTARRLALEDGHGLNVEEKRYTELFAHGLRLFLPQLITLPATFKPQPRQPG